MNAANAARTKDDAGGASKRGRMGMGRGFAVMFASNHVRIRRWRDASRFFLRAREVVQHVPNSLSYLAAILAFALAQPSEVHQRFDHLIRNRHGRDTFAGAVAPPQTTLAIGGRHARLPHARSCAPASGWLQSPD